MLLLGGKRILCGKSSQSLTTNYAIYCYLVYPTVVFFCCKLKGAESSLQQFNSSPIKCINIFYFMSFIKPIHCAGRPVNMTELNLNVCYVINLKSIKVQTGVFGSMK